MIDRITGSIGRGYGFHPKSASSGQYQNRNNDRVQKQLFEPAYGMAVLREALIDFLVQPVTQPLESGGEDQKVPIIGNKGWQLLRQVFPVTQHFDHGVVGPGGRVSEILNINEIDKDGSK